MQVVIALAIVAIMVVFYGYYATSKLKNKVLVIYHRPSGQVLEQFAKLDDRTVDIDGKRFTISPDRRSLMWYIRGIHKYFPTWVIVYEFSFYSKYPHNPDDFKDTVVSPSVARTLNNEARMKSLSLGVQNQGGTKKGGFFEKYLPIIIIVLILLIVVVGVFVFSMNSDMNVVKKTLQDILTNK